MNGMPSLELISLTRDNETQSVHQFEIKDLEICNWHWEQMDSFRNLLIDMVFICHAFSCHEIVNLKGSQIFFPHSKHNNYEPCHSSESISYNYNYDLGTSDTSKPITTMTNNNCFKYRGKAIIISDIFWSFVIWANGFSIDCFVTRPI